MNIVIIGGGFAGIALAKSLKKNKDFQITLVDRNNYNFFPPLIYQVATAFLEPSSISYPFRKLFRGYSNVHFRLGELKKVFPAEKKIELSNGEVFYDVLVFATGAETNYFGMENVKRNAIPMKTLGDAIEMRNKLLGLMEEASITQDPAEIKKLLTIVIAGGGPTGVEISGMFAEMKRGILRKEYPELAGKAGNIYLVDGGDALLSPMSVKSQQDTLEALTKLGIKVRLNSHVKDFVDGKVLFANGEFIETSTMIWAAGVTASIFEGLPTVSYGRGKRMVSDAYNKVQAVDNIYAIGDTCIQTTDLNFPAGHPQVAQVAIQQGENLAHNLKAAQRGQAIKPFVYTDKGSMAIIGRNKAVADLPKPKLHFKGFIAWVLWLVVHLISLINFRNKLMTLYNWTGAYFTQDQPLRMIIRPADRDKQV